MKKPKNAEECAQFYCDTYIELMMAQATIRLLEKQVKPLEGALTKILALKPVNMAQDHFSREMGLRPDDVFDICEEALAAVRSVATPS